MHVPGVLNVVTDFSSRHRPSPVEWRLNSEVVKMIWQRRIVSVASTHCTLWVSWTKKSNLLGQDALAHNLARFDTLCLFPTPLILPALHRIFQRHHRMLLVALNWPGRPRFPMLCRLLKGDPWSLPRRQDLFLQLQGQIWHPTPGWLQVCVWLPRKSCDIKVQMNSRAPSTRNIL